MSFHVNDAGSLENYKPSMYISADAASSDPEASLSDEGDEHPPGFETNAGSFRGGKNRASGEEKAEPKGRPRGSFRDFYEKRKAEAGKKPKFVPPEEPTLERQAKGDRPKKTRGGFFRAPPPIERLRDRKALDEKPHVANAMCEAATRLYQCFYEAGLNGVAAQDLSREVRGGGTSNSSFPRTERSMHFRRKFREACDAMGWFPDYPHRGAGRITVSVVCYEIGVEDAAKLHIGKGRLELTRSNALDRLREGLFTLARHWRLI